MDFEKKLEQLEKIVNKMEGGDLSLDQALKDFEKGVQLSRECQKSLDEAELQVKKLLSVSENGEVVDEDFQEE